MDIGTRITKIRKKMGFKSTSSFARAAEIPQTTLSGIEAGRNSPTWDTVERISKALGMEPWVLVGPLAGGSLTEIKENTDVITMHQLMQVLPPRRKHLMREILKDWLEETTNEFSHEEAAAEEAVG